MTFKVYNLGSKRPRLHRAYVLGVFTNISTTVLMNGRTDKRKVGNSYLDLNSQDHTVVYFAL